MFLLSAIVGVVMAALDLREWGAPRRQLRPVERLELAAPTRSRDLSVPVEIRWITLRTNTAHLFTP